MKKTFLAVMALTIGLLLLSGAEVNPVQGFIALPLMGLGVYILRSVECDEKRQSLPDDRREADVQTPDTEQPISGKTAA